MNFSSTGPSRGLQFSTNRSRMGTFHEVLSFRNGLLQHGSPMGSQVLLEDLLQHRISMGSQPPSGLHLL